MFSTFSHKHGDLPKVGLIFFIFCTQLIFLTGAQMCTVDADCVPLLGNLSECINDECVCGEYYVLHPIDDRCLKVASYNSSCEVDDQCQGALGLESRCNKMSLRCECFSPRVPQTNLTYSDGRCYIMRGLGEPCVEDNECIVRSDGEIQNGLGRCVNETCACHNNAALSLHSMEMETPGLCQIHCPECKVIDISILMSCLSGSLFLVAFIYSMIRMANPKEIEEKA